MVRSRREAQECLLDVFRGLVVEARHMLICSSLATSLDSSQIRLENSIGYLQGDVLANELRSGADQIILNTMVRISGVL